MSKLTQEQKAVWIDHFNAHRNSGLSQQAYCEQQSLKSNQFWYWKNKIEGSTKTYRKTTRQNTSARQQGFVPVQISPQPSKQGLTISLPNGIVLSGIDEQNHLLVHQLIGVLK